MARKKSSSSSKERLERTPSISETRRDTPPLGHGVRRAHSFQMSPETRPLGRRPSGLTLLPRGRSSSAASAISSSPPVLSFKELQRLSAMKTELFGFGGWLASTLLYVLFLVWAYVPDSTLQAYGMTYFPSKHWALAIPSMIVISYIFSIVTYFAMNLLSTPPLESYATMFDVHSVFLTDDHVDAHVEAATPPISDIPIMQVNQLQLLDD